MHVKQILVHDEAVANDIAAKLKAGTPFEELSSQYSLAPNAKKGGEIFVDGNEVTHLSGRRRDAILRQFGMLFQGSALFDSLPVWENVAFGLIQGRGMARQRAKDVAIEKLAKVGLGPEVAELWPAELSGGMQKRVGLARAIAAEPDIIFFDEPTTGLDPIMADVLNDLIVSTVKRLGGRV